MPGWMPANVTDEQRRAVEQFANYRHLSRQEAAGLLIAAGIEAMRPVVSTELAARHEAIRAVLLPRRPAGAGWEPKA